MDIRPNAPAPEPCRCCKGKRGRLVGFQLVDLKMKVTLCTVCDTGPSFGQGPPVLVQAIQEGWA
jgi:hypothetical protein